MNIRRNASSISPEARARRFGPWPWYLSAADVVGLDVGLVDDIVGDLIEECSARAPEQGGALARLWCVGQIVRSIPHLASNTMRRGQRRARLRLIGTMCTMLLAATAGIAALQMRDGPPVRILTDRPGEENGIVINNVIPVKLPIRVVDARGHTLEPTDVRYEWVGGDRVNLTAEGALSCASKADARVRATVGDVVSLMNIRCRPVSSIESTSWVDFIPGDQPRQIAFVAHGPDGSVVTDLRGTMVIRDSTVATIANSVVTPLRLGAAPISINIGDRSTGVLVIVHEVVKRFDNLTASQRHVALPINISRGDTTEYPIPTGTMWVKYLPRDGGIVPPTITMQGPGFCTGGDELNVHYLPEGEYGALCYVGAGTRVRVAHGAVASPVLNGVLMLDRMR